MKILLVEDTPSLAHIYAGHLNDAGYVVTHVENGRDALRAAARGQYAGFVIDLGLPDMDGVDLIGKLQDAGVCPVFLVVTANASIIRAVEAVREGAYDYLVKPVTKNRLVETLETALKASSGGSLAKSSREGNSGPERKLSTGLHGFVGNSLKMQAVFQTIEHIAQSKASVFISGQSGTGKEVCAEAIHQASPRTGQPFVAINCGAIPKDLMESEIFGHLKGSFTGAISDRDGAACQASGGTLFLDEICELDLNMQTKLLRFLQTGEIQRVGSNKSEKVDVRIICATNRDPEAELTAGRFREDLFYRLHVLPVHMPPLNERGDDVMLLADHFLAQYSCEENRRFTGFDSATRAALYAHHWPGNVRELQNIVRQIVVLHDSAEVNIHMLPAPLAIMSAGTSTVDGCARAETSRQSGTEAMGDKVIEHPSSCGASAGRELWRIERDAINSAISECGGSIPKAARRLGVSPSTLYRKRDSWQEQTRQAS